MTEEYGCIPEQWRAATLRAVRRYVRMYVVANGHLYSKRRLFKQQPVWPMYILPHDNGKQYTTARIHLTIIVV